MSDLVIGDFTVFKNSPLVTRARPLTSDGTDVFSGDVDYWTLNVVNLSQGGVAVFSIAAQSDATTVLSTSLRQDSAWPFSDGYSFKHTIGETAFMQVAGDRYFITYLLHTPSNGPVYVKSQGFIDVSP